MNSRIRRPLYIFPLNPDYVAARSLRSLRSNYVLVPVNVKFFTGKSENETPRTTFTFLEHGFH